MLRRATHLFITSGKSKSPVTEFSQIFHGKKDKETLFVLSMDLF